MPFDPLFPLENRTNVMSLFDISVYSLGWHSLNLIFENSTNTKTKIKTTKTKQNNICKQKTIKILVVRVFPRIITTTRNQFVNQSQPISEKTQTTTLNTTTQHE